MAWFKRPRNPADKQRHEPTYDVDRDGPPWQMPRQYDKQWERKQFEEHVAAELALERRLYDAYPDHGSPFEGLESPVNVAAKRRSPPVVTGEVRLMVSVNYRTRVVRLDSGFLELYDPKNRIQQATLARAVKEAIDRASQPAEAPPEPGQGLAEYALLLALIAVAVIVAALLLGSQLSGILNAVGGCLQDAPNC